ncbi:endopeptidase La [Candidatus Epulonipiscium fishelsonii]|uniref:Endopeptidase La n=1 Tax=Candidatus Epulonipiscium fishelsonii TaxID=77094 RepID=A0ACC8XEK5_9FIRM|nr:endopeptidase La [Epulopiscium sp. SCG-D08WGA-EpuloA1]OON90691.1 MAG: endopeptidase La [Epulopiscium sp. AS2M-Bin002]
MNKIIDLPVVPLRGLTLFPEMILQFDIGRKKSIQAIEAAVSKDKTIFLSTQKDATDENPNFEGLFEVGTIAKVRQVLNISVNKVKIIVYGVKRAKLLSIHNGIFMEGVIQEIDDELTEDTVQEALMRTIAELFEKYASLTSKINQETVYSILGKDQNNKIVDAIAAQMTLEVSKKQDILSEINFNKRIEKLIDILNDEINVNKFQKQIYEKVKVNIDKNQKDYYLREQLKVIQNELGDKTSFEEEYQQYNEKMNSTNIPQYVKDKLQKEVKRLNKISQNSPEYHILKNYIENILEIPWGIFTEENQDIKKAENILNEEHYGLEQIKERIIEYLAVKKLNPNSISPIFCLVGPPGIGKTSIIQSIATATGRNYVSIALGGIRDEAEIRGHRKTYMGSMPGRFIQGLKNAKSVNPLMLLDEIDKMSMDFRGDPSAALLEVLDTKQNIHFKDNYTEIPVDLSKVMFIATANNLQNVPTPLIDRMEIIDISSYNEDEKFKIASQYLIPKQMQLNGILKTQLKFTENIIRYIIVHYTKEAGVRNLEREIGKICRKVAKEIIEGKKRGTRLSINRIHKYLGTPKFTYMLKDTQPEVGIVRGLAWTMFGGDTLNIEVNITSGKGLLELTGNMGDVMKESAKAAISYTKFNQELLKIAPEMLKKYDIHIHIPEGATPKDGPSAGITMATAIISAFTEKKVRNDIAMTGEITIRGKVLAIGGLKEKISAAKRAGIFNIIVPKDNKKNVLELSKKILNKVNIIYVETMNDVLKHTFVTEDKEPLFVEDETHISVDEKKPMLIEDKEKKIESRINYYGRK